MGRPFSLTYTRPKYVASLSSRDSLADVKNEGSVRSGSSGSSGGIPDSLSFDNLMSGGACPPMTVRDFMNYLVYIEHGAENLQFWLWYRNYVTRFDYADTVDLALAPEWTQDMEDDAVAKIRKNQAESMRPDPRAAGIIKGTAFEKHPRETAAANPFDTPPHTPLSGGTRRPPASSRTDPRCLPSSAAYIHRFLAAEAYTSAGVEPPFTIQPFREEVSRVIATYIGEGSPRQLNLASWERKAAIHALANTTHPSALRIIFKTVDASLRRQAHPNFVRWSICNGNPARVFFARALGSGLIAGGLATGVLITLSKVGRGYRALASVALVLGICTLFAAYKGMCVVLHGMHHRHVRPWELFEQDGGGGGGEAQGAHSYRSFGYDNTYEDEPWVVQYRKRSVVRKVFDREVWIQEPALRQIQDTIFVQAVLVSLVLGGALTAVFVTVPGGNFF